MPALNQDPRKPPQGLLVRGGNHFVVNGVRPTIEQARLLMRKWELPMLGPQPAPPPELEQWSICKKAFREDLGWALVLRSDEASSAAVITLLEELAVRGVEIIHG